MDKQRIETIIALRPQIQGDKYSDEIVELFTPPKWYRPIKRLRWFRQLPLRVRVIMAEYARELINAVVPTTQKPIQAPEANPGAKSPTYRPNFTIPVPNQNQK